MRRILYIVIILLVAFLIIALIPVDSSRENAIKVSGTVKSVTEGGVQDLVFELKDDEITYYINRGLENRFELGKAKKDFEGKKITLFYADSWTPIAPFGTSSKHISHAVVNDSIIYNEW